jgi:TPP-dependent pyruvate/acetoin dehydrogenase alpha subunit
MSALRLPPRSVSVARRDTERLVLPTALAQARGLIQVLDEESREAPLGLSSSEARTVHQGLVLLALVGERLRPSGDGPDELRVTQDRSAAIVGAVRALDAADWLFPDPGDRGALLVRGAPLASYLALRLGGGLPRRSGPGEPGLRSRNVVPVATPLGSHLTQATGAAWAARLRHDPVVMMATCGPTATGGDEFHVALNFAGLMRAPVVFVCHSDRESVAHETGAETLAEKGLAYEVPGVRVDGGDVLAVGRVCAAAVARARRGEGPTLVEALVDRGDGVPLERLERFLAARGLLPAEEAAAIRTTLAGELDRVLATVGGEVAELGQLCEGVFAAPPWHLREQLREAEASRG